MSDCIQAFCPESKKREVIEVGNDASGRPCVTWCSRKLGCPRCPQACLAQLKTVGHIMLTEVPRLELRELPRLTVDQLETLFEGFHHSVVPVLDEEKLVGSLSYREVAAWRDHRTERSGLSCQEWSQNPNDCVKLRLAWDEEEKSVRPTDCWKVAADKLLASHRDEIFVVDEAGCFLGLVYARQLLRIAIQEGSES